MTPEPLACNDVGAGTAILLIHGLTFSRHTWDPIAERLAARHRVIAVDLPGHGDSTGSAADPVAVVERLAATLSGLEVPPPVVVGHSAGALTALGLAATHPVRGVVNVDQPLLVGPFAGMVQQLAPALRGPAFDETFQPFEQSIGVGMLPEPERSRVSATRRVHQDLVLDHWQLPMTTPPPELQGMVDELLAAVSVPYLYLAGDELPPPVAEHLRTHLRDPQIVTWPGNGHLVQLMAPERFVDLLDWFTDEVCAAGTATDPIASPPPT